MNRKWGILVFGLIVLMSLLAMRWEDSKVLVLSTGFLLISPFVLPITGIPYIALLILFVLSMIGILRNDKHDDAKLFYGFRFSLFMSIVGMMLICYFSFLFILSGS